MSAPEQLEHLLRRSIRAVRAQRGRRVEERAVLALVEHFGVDPAEVAIAARRPLKDVMEIVGRKGKYARIKCLGAEQIRWLEEAILEPASASQQRSSATLLQWAFDHMPRVAKR